MEKTEIFLKNAKNLVNKKGIRCNRSIQQVNKMEAGDPVGAGDHFQSWGACM
jgi:hypothetical protein